MSIYNFFIISICLLMLNTNSTQQAIGDIKLLEGYAYKSMPNVDTRTATISKENGIIIDIEYGLTGKWANITDASKYAWYKEQTINGHKFIFALIKPGLKSVWEPAKPRTKEEGNILLITVPLRTDEDYAANFKAEIENSEEITEVLLMVLILNPSKLD